MKILTAGQMRAVDRRTIEEIGIPGPVLMENAGLRVVQALKKRSHDLRCGKIVIAAGKGNNGGDGLVVARHLWDMGIRPEIFLLAAREDVSGDAAVNLKAVLNMGIPVRETVSPADWKKAAKAMAGAAVIIDAIFGTGLTSPLEGNFASIVAAINASQAFKVAVDIPSGLSSDTPSLIGPCVRADLTVALAAPKVAHIFPPAEECVGELVIAPIGIPLSLLEDPELKLELVEGLGLCAQLGKRRRESHKGTYGHVLVVAGSLGKTGAATLAGRAALKTGAGLVTVATPAACLPMIARSMAELMTEPLLETGDKTIAASAVTGALKLVRGKDAVIIGPGLSTNPETAEFVGAFLPKVRVPMVIDADALNILAGKPQLLDRLAAPAVLTPHPGEFARMLGMKTEDVLAHRLELAPEFAQKHKLHLVLKGHRTLIACPDGMVYVNPTGNPGMATGGSGDVLSGMLASFLAQEKDPLKACLLAVYLHGLSGDLGALELGERSLTAGDIIRYIPRALKEMSE